MPYSTLPLHPGSDPVGDAWHASAKSEGTRKIELADRIGVIQSLISSYKSGALKLPAGITLRFAGALEVSVEEILEPGKKKSKTLLSRVEECYGD